MLCEILTTLPTNLGTYIPGHSAVLVGRQLGQLAVLDEQLSHLRSTNILQVDIARQRLWFKSVNPLLWLNLVSGSSATAHCPASQCCTLAKTGT